MKSWEKDFDKKFGGLVIVSKTKSFTEEDMKDFIAKQRTQLLKEVREKVVLGSEIYFHQTGKVSIESGIKEQLKKLAELEKDK